jgi:urea transporter
MASVNDAVRAFGHDDDVSHEDVIPQADSKGAVPKYTVVHIVHDIFMTGNMPMLMTYCRDYEFYPAEVEPQGLSLCQHSYWYARNTPFLLLYYTNIVLRGIGQVYICNHPVTGLLVCIGLWISSPTLMAYAIIGSAVETLGAWLVCRPPTEDIEAGLFG